MFKTRQSVFPFLVLSLIVLFTYSLFVDMPYLGFYYSYLDEITDIFVPEGEPLLGGRIVRVDGEDFVQLKSNYFKPLFDGLQAGDTVALTIEKEGQLVDVNWTLPNEKTNEILARIKSTWWLPFMFWVAGLITWFNVRPRNTIWQLLVLFNMLIAVYLSALNGPSLGNRLFSVPFVRFIGCMVLPVFLHLHWEFPSSLAKLSSRFYKWFYAVVAIVGVLTAFNVLPVQTSILLSILAVIGSIMILIVKLFKQKNFLVDNRFLLGTFSLIFVPPLVTTVSYTNVASPINYFGFTGVYLAMAALPSAYFLVAFNKQIYGERTRNMIRNSYLILVLVSSFSIIGLQIFISRQGVVLGMDSILLFIGVVAILSFSIVVIPMFGAISFSERMDSSRKYFSTGLEPRSNRLLTPYLFLITGGVFMGFVLVLFSGPFDLLSVEFETISVTGFLVAGFTLGGYPVFRNWLNQRIYGTSASENDLRDSFARRITTMLSIPDIAKLIKTEILPSLEIRQSLLYYLNDQGSFQLILSTGVGDHELINQEDLETALPQMKSALIFRDSVGELLPDWVQVMYRLSAQGKLIGFWILGHRDPDNEYTFSMLSTLQTISNQLSVALANVIATNKLHAHYRADIARKDAARIEIARGLHDQVLNQLASLGMQISSDVPKGQLIESYEKTKFGLREIIKMLRPAVLDFGLAHAIHDITDQLLDVGDTPKITVELSIQSPRYDNQVETQIYRIVQQILENAIEHSSAAEIVISGDFLPDRIILIVQDDGVGFDYEKMSTAWLIDQRHFGLVGMRERAELIHATLIINSSLGSGTKIQLNWQETKHD